MKQETRDKVIEALEWISKRYEGYLNELANPERTEQLTRQGIKRVQEGILICETIREALTLLQEKEIENTKEHVFIKPTVADVIAFLQKQKPDAPFRIEDADTNWTIETFPAHVDDKGVVWFGAAEFSKMVQW